MTNKQGKQTEEGANKRVEEMIKKGEVFICTTWDMLPKPITDIKQIYGDK